MSFIQKVGVLKKILFSKAKIEANENLYEYTKLIVGKLTKVSELRNSCIHGFWHSRDEDGYIRTKVKFNDEVEVYKKIIDIADLNNCINLIVDLTIEISQLVERVWYGENE